MLLYSTTPLYTPGFYLEEGVLHPISSVEVYLPWNNTWLELPSLPYMDPGRRMEFTRIFSLNLEGVPRLHLLGGDYAHSSGGITLSSTVWGLLWNYTNNSYYWTTKWSPPMGEIY